MDDTKPEDYSAPRTPGQAEGTEDEVTGDDVTGSGHSTEKDVRQPTPGQAEGEDDAA